MRAQRQTPPWMLLAGYLATLPACETKPLPVVTAASAAPSSSTQTPPVPFSPNPALLADRPDEHTNPRRVLARIQGDLERAAADKPTFVLPKDVKADPLEAIVPAYRAVVKADKGAADALAQIVTLAQARLEPKMASAKKNRVGRDDALPAGHAIEAYVQWVSKAAQEPVKDAEGLMVRLVATMRLVDAALLLEGGHMVYDDSYDLFLRRDEMFLRPIDHFRDDVWLRLPCPTIRNHRPALVAADKRLGKAAGPILSCPTPEKHEHDFDFMQRFANNPGETASALVVRSPQAAPKRDVPQDPVAPPPPWKEDVAIDFMSENPDAAEKPLADAAAKHVVGKLDYALFLHAFRPQSATRDEKIKKLIADVDKASGVAAKKSDDEFLMNDSSIGRKDYDGSDESLIGSIRLASSTGAANTTSAFYSIPCAILLARPKLLDATEPLFGGNRDNFLPRAGCSWGRGFVKGFPDADVAAWRDATEEADGKFLFNFSGTMRFGYASAKNLEAETMRTNPLALLKEDAPKMSWPYETWSYMTPESRSIYQKLLTIVEPLHNKLVAHYKLRGINEKDAGRIAKTGLFRVVWGAPCGDAAPPRTLRKLVVDGASPAEIRAFVAADEHKDETRLEPFQACAKATGMDPLIHVAVLHPETLPVVWDVLAKPIENAKDLDLEIDPNAPNHFGKTPLMVAAQQDRVPSAKLLLEHGASVARTTFKRASDADAPELGHDARTALMYAAARGSLDMLRLLLDRGADKYAADTKGRRALHYLLGQGPVAANPKLSGAELSEAAQLLY